MISHCDVISVLCSVITVLILVVRCFFIGQILKPVILMFVCSRCHIGAVVVQFTVLCDYDSFQYCS